LGLNRKHVSIARIRENAAIEVDVGSELEIRWHKDGESSSNSTLSR
jgi:hypothetical protein